MNKWQKVACQIARDDLKKPFNRNRFEFRKLRNETLKIYKKEDRKFERLVDYKNWNKGIEY